MVDIKGTPSRNSPAQARAASPGSGRALSRRLARLARTWAVKLRLMRSGATDVRSSGSSRRAGRAGLKLKPEAGIAILLLLTFLAVRYEDALLQRTLVMNGPGSSAVSYWYDDRSTGGGSKVISDPVRPNAWTCELKEGAAEPHCASGLQFNADDASRGIDLSAYRTIEIELSYRGPSRSLRLNLKNFDPRYSRLGDPTSDKFHTIDLTLNSERAKAVAPLADLRVPDWWLQGKDLPKELDGPEFDNIVALELRTGPGSRPGRHQIRIHGITARGAVVTQGQWYLVIGAVWLTALLLLLLHYRRQRLQHEKNLAARWSRTLDAIPQMVWSTTPEGDEYYNARWKEFAGVQVDGRQGVSPLDLIHPDDRERVAAAWETSFSTGTPCEAEYRVRHRSGDYRWMLSRRVPEQDEEGQVVRWYGTVTDINDQKLAQSALRETEERFRLAISATQDAVWDWQFENDEVLWSDAFYRTYGHDPAEVERTGAWWLEQIHPDERDRVARSIHAAIDGGETTWCDEYRLRCGDGSYAHVFDRGTILRDEAGVAYRMIGAVLDMTERKRSEQALRESELLHRSILQASADCIMMISLGGDLELMNSPGLAAFELDDFKKVEGRPWEALWPQAARKAAAAALAEARSGKVARLMDLCPTAKGTAKWWDVVVTPMFDDHGRVIRLLAIARDITASRKAADQLKWASEHDGLTSLPNRRCFQAHLQAATVRAMQSGEVVGLLLLDLDHFKHVNDTLGHAAGDHLLKTFADRLKQSIRSDDFVARLGGDEFAVILRGTGEKEMRQAGQSILRRLQAPIAFDGRVISAGASIGGALFPRDASSANELFNNADSALYALKGEGRGGITMFHQHMRQQAQKVASQLSLARIAISEKSVIPYYQPKIHLASGRIAGFEALLRWKHPSRGIQLPETVAEAFKDYELASKIGELMQEKVLDDVRSWIRAGINFPHVSINAAPAEFLRDDYAERLLRLMSAREVPAQLVEVEVTEHVFLERGSEYVARALTHLKRAGVRIALDDFGTGYSSLSHLRDFPVDVVKIDRSFVEKMVEETEISSIVTAVIDLATSLRIEVVAEGIETELQRAALVEKGCSIGQGYLFGRPAAADEVRRLIQRGAREAA